MSSESTRATTSPVEVADRTLLSRLSLELKLPLAIAALLLVVLGAALALTYREVTRSAARAALAMLQRATRELANSVDVSTAARMRLQRQVAADSTVQRALTGMPMDSGALHAELDKLVLPGDSGLPTELWTASGRRIVRWGLSVAPESESPPPGVRPAGADSVRLGPLYSSAGRVYFWTVIPVPNVARPPQLLGWIVRQRRVATPPQTEQQIRGLVGSDVSVYFGNDTGGFWSTLGGTPASSPRRASIVHGLPSFDRAERGQVTRVLAAEAPLRGTPWKLALELPEGAAIAGARAILSRLGGLALVLLIAGVLAAWMIGRRVARPLVDLAGAAERVAAGEYSKIEPGPATAKSRSRVAGEKRDEVARLAGSFNRMIDEVISSHAALEVQVDEAQSLAEELEHTNAQLEETAREAHEARTVAESANAAKDQFLAHMSHELRTPLNAIIGYAQLVEMGVGGPVTDLQRDYLTRLAVSSKHLLTLVDDVLDIAKTDAQQMTVAHEHGMSEPAIASAVADVEPQANSKGVAIVHGGSAGENVAYVGDEQRVRQILVNLLSNAVKFTPRGGTVTLGASLADEVPSAARFAGGGGPWACIRVADTGIGIPFERQSSVFEPFVQGESGLTRSRGGTGLGLTISRRLARLMGGDITLESAPGSGSAFTLWLPAPRAASLDRATRAAAAAAAADRSAHSHDQPVSIESAD